MRIGDLNRRIELQAPVDTADGMGGSLRTWNLESIVWAAVWPVSANERIQANAPTMSISHRVRIRYRDDIKPDWRIKFGSRYLSIVSIINLNESDKQLDLMCREVMT